MYKVTYMTKDGLQTEYHETPAEALYQAKRRGWEILSVVQVMAA